MTVYGRERTPRQPPAASRLTEFYLGIALGGVLGGAFNALRAPVLFVIGENDSPTVRHTAEKLRRFAQLSANSVWEQLGRPGAAPPPRRAGGA